MFTGIIQEVGKLVDFRREGSTARLRIAAQVTCRDAQPGDSICTNGVCLTAEHIESGQFVAGLSSETLKRTTFADLAVGSALNIEPSLRPMDRMGGHIVAGHVDGIGEIVSLTEEGEFWNLVLSFPDNLARFIAEKGSVAIDGISLTVTYVEDLQAGIAVVPYTLQETNLAHQNARNRVNLEVDLLARYVDRLLQAGRGSDGHGGLTAEQLKRYGY